jgi:3-oxoacyl-[acyl-carrier-protein] synthase III
VLEVESPEATVAPRPAPAPAARRGAAVTAVGAAVPAQVVSNAPIARRLGVDERWIVTRTGVRERRVADPGERLADYAAAAARRALAASGTRARGVDLVLVATMSHERLTPSAAAEVASRIGADGAGAIDVGAACSGFVSALALAAAQIEARRADTVLVVGADLMTRLTDDRDRGTAALFGDGAGAVVVGASHGARVSPAILGSDGSRGELVTAERAEAIVRMQGQDTFRQAVARLSEATVAAAAAAGCSLHEIDLFAYHQANARILRAVTERLGLEPERVLECIDRYGNTSAATIPLALAEAERSGRLRPDTRVLLAAFGGGLTWAATVLEWGNAPEDGHGKA